MGVLKEMAMDIAQQNYIDEKTEWIRGQLNDEDADELTTGWDEI